MPKQKTIQNQKGFTIIELITVIFMMAILLSVFLASYSANSGKRNLTLAQSNLLSDLRKAQGFALSSRNYSGSTPASQWAVYFDTTNNQIYKIRTYDNTLSQNVSDYTTINLPSNIYIKTISVKKTSGTSYCAQTLSVLFTVPYGRVNQTYNGGGSCATAATNSEANDVTTITLSTTDNASTNTIIINGIAGDMAAP